MAEEKTQPEQTESPSLKGEETAKAPVKGDAELPKKEKSTKKATGKAKSPSPEGEKAAAPKAHHPEGGSSKGKKGKKKPKKRLVPEGKVFIQASFNNTIVTIATPDGEALAQSSAGANGFKGPKKATPYAAQVSAEKAAEKAKIYGMERVHVVVKGAGNGREQAIRGLQSGGLNVESIVDVTTVPHNGCRQKKTRRV